MLGSWLTLLVRRNRGNIRPCCLFGGGVLIEEKFKKQLKSCLAMNDSIGNPVFKHLCSIHKDGSLPMNVLGSIKLNSSEPSKLWYVRPASSAARVDVQTIFIVCGVKFCVCIAQASFINEN